MKSQKYAYKPIISNIHLIASKEFGTGYNPYGSNQLFSDNDSFDNDQDGFKDYDVFPPDDFDVFD